MGLSWISEAKALPRIGQHVFLALPRQTGEFWDMDVACILALHEGVLPKPVIAGEKWPTNYWWGRGRSVKDTCLITGNGWWASLSSIELPPKAKHANQMGYDYIEQIGSVFVSMRKGESTF